MKIMSKDNGVFEGISLTFEKRNNTSKDTCDLNEHFRYENKTCESMF